MAVNLLPMSIPGVAGGEDGGLDVDMKRKLAELMLRENMQRSGAGLKIEHPLQGVAHMADSLTSALMYRNAMQEAQKARGQGADDQVALYERMLQRSQPAQPAPAPAPTPPPPVADLPMPGATGGVDRQALADAPQPQLTEPIQPAQEPNPISQDMRAQLAAALTGQNAPMAPPPGPQPSEQDMMRQYEASAASRIMGGNRGAPQPPNMPDPERAALAQSMIGQPPAQAAAPKGLSITSYARGEVPAPQGQPPMPPPQMAPQAPPQQPQPMPQPAPQQAPAPAAQPRQGGWQPKNLILHDYGVPPNVNLSKTANNPYHALVYPDGSIRYRNEADPYGSKAPHAYKMNGDAIGLSYAGPVGSRPTPEAMETLRKEYEKINQQFPGITSMGHGEAYQKTKGTPQQASRDGRDLNEASWRTDLKPQPVRVADVSGGMPLMSLGQGGTPAPQAQPKPAAPQQQMAQATQGMSPDETKILRRMLASPDQSVRAAAGQIMQRNLQRNMPPTASEALDMEMKRAQIDQLKAKPEAQMKEVGGRLVVVDPRNPSKAQWLEPPNANGMSPDAQKAYDKELGESRAKAQTSLPTVLDTTQNALKTIEQIRTHPGRSTGTGITGKVMPYIPGTDARGFANLVDQATGQTFLEAFNSLRGGGQITEAEGKKATQALARLDRAQNERDFNSALTDLQDVLQTGAQRAKNLAAGKYAPTQPAQQAPQLPQGWSVRRLD